MSPEKHTTYRLIRWNEPIISLRESVARFARRHKVFIPLAIMAVPIGIGIVIACTDGGLNVFDRQFSIKAYDPYPKGRHEAELALYMFEKSENPGQKTATGILANLSAKHVLRINYIRGGLVPQSFISIRPSR